MSEPCKISDLESENVFLAYEAEDEDGYPCLIIEFFGFHAQPMKITSQAERSGWGPCEVIVPLMPKVEYVTDMSKIKRKAK